MTFPIKTFMHNQIGLFNYDQPLWEAAAKSFRQRPDGGPTIRVLEGHVWGVPRGGHLAQFETSEEAERVFLAAGFKFIEVEKGFRA